MTITEQLDTLYTTTWANRRAGVADNIFNSTPFYYWLKEKGGLKKEEGGRRIEMSIRHGKSPNIGWIGKGSTAGMSDMDHLTIAYYPWRYLIDSIVRFMVDDQQNRSKPRIINLMNSKIDTAQDSLTEQMEIRLCQSAGATGNITVNGDTIAAAPPGTHPAMNGLQDLVPDNPTTGTVGGINAANNQWWRSKTQSASGSSFATNGFGWMQKMLNNTMNNLGMDRPEIIFCGQTPYEYYDDDVTDQRRIVNKTLGDQGFENIEFKGIPMIWSAYAPSSMYFLATKFLHFVYDPMFFFDMTEWKTIPNQPNDRAAQIVTAGNFVTNRRRCQGVIHTINTA